MQENNEFQLDPLNQPCPTPNAALDAGCASSCPLHSPAFLKLLELFRPRPFRKRHPVIFWGGIVLLLLAIGGGAMEAWDAATPPKDSLAVVRVEGLIADTRPLLRWIDTVSRDDSVKGVLLRIDSPGGGAAASQELYEALKRLDERKPVVASMGSVAASGGLMTAMAAQYVVANPSTVTGSIGVRMDLPQVQKLLDKLGVGQETITTGRFKDAGSMTRPLTPEDRAYFSRVLQDMHEQFVLLVAEGRRLPVDVVRTLADGRIMTGREAKEHKLVDALGGQDVALARLSALTGVSADRKVQERPKEKTLWREVLETVFDVDFTAQSGVPAFLFAY